MSDHPFNDMVGFGYSVPHDKAAPTVDSYSTKRLKYISKTYRICNGYSVINTTKESGLSRMPTLGTCQGIAYS